jgi:hypothetical protein
MLAAAAAAVVVVVVVVVVVFDVFFVFAVLCVCVQVRRAWERPAAAPSGCVAVRRAREPGGVLDAVPQAGRRRQAGGPAELGWD